MYDALDIAKYIVSKCINEKSPITNLQLQRILYIIQKDFLKRGSPAFADSIEAWGFGPAIPRVYYHFGTFGAEPITFIFDSPSINPLDALRIMDVVRTKRDYDPYDLSQETLDNAWAQTYKNGEGNRQKIPLDALIK